MSNKKAVHLQKNNKGPVAESIQVENFKDGKFSDLVIYGVLSLVLLIYGFARFQLLEIPLERDEGSYAYIGQLLLDGQLPYKDFYEMKLPGLYYLYALIVLVTGQTANGLHLGFGIIILLSAFLVYQICKSLFNRESGLIGAIAFCAFSLAPGVFGFTAQAEHLISFQVIVSFYLICKNTNSNKWYWWFLAGMVFTNAIFTKQIAVVYSPVYLLLMSICLYKIHKKYAVKDFIQPVLWSAIGSISIAAFWFGLMMILGVWDEMMFWVFEYPKKYASTMTWDQRKDSFYGALKNLYFEYILLWLLGIMGILLGLLKRENRLHSIFILLMFLVSILAVFPGYYFYPHYWIYVDVPIAIGAGFGFYNVWYFTSNTLGATPAKILTIFSVVILLLSDVSKRKEYYFNPKHNAISKSIYGTNPFVECKEIAKKLNLKSKPGDEMIVFGSEPQLNFYTNMRTPTRHFFMGFLTKGHKEEEKWIAEVKKDVESKMPRFLVHVVQPFSWVYMPNVKTDLFDYGFSIAAQHYNLIGIADMKDNKPVYAWDKEVLNYPPMNNGDMRVLVYELKSDRANK